MYITKIERDSLMNRIQFILSLDLLLRLTQVAKPCYQVIAYIT